MYDYDAKEYVLVESEVDTIEDYIKNCIRSLHTFDDFVATKLNATIGLAVSTFNRKKAAFEFRRSAIRNTGSLDINRIAYYKTSEDIFRSSTIEAKGKNHAVILNIDTSYSILNTIEEIVKQALIFAAFAKKSGIKFVIRTFTTVSRRDSIGTFNLGGGLVEIANDSYTLDEIVTSLKEILLAASFYKTTYHGYNSRGHDLFTSSIYKGLFADSSPLIAWADEIRNTYQFGNTPITHAALLSLETAHNYRKAGVQIVRIYTITDGDNNVSIRNEKGNATTIIDPSNGRRFSQYEDCDYGHSDSLRSIVNTHKFIEDSGFPVTIIRIINTLTKRNVRRDGFLSWEALGKFEDSYKSGSKFYRIEHASGFLGASVGYIVDASVFKRQKAVTLDNVAGLTARQMAKKIMGQSSNDYSRKLLDVIASDLAQTFDLKRVDKRKTLAV